MEMKNLVANIKFDICYPVSQQYGIENVKMPKNNKTLFTHIFKLLMLYKNPKIYFFVYSGCSWLTPYLPTYAV